MNPTAKKVFKLTGAYTSSVAAYGKPPKGFRFLKLGEETDPKTDWFWNFNGWTRETISERGICEAHVPFIRRLSESVAPKTKTLPDIGDKMKIPEFVGPRMRDTVSYATNMAEYGPAPKGWRWREPNEKINFNTDLWAAAGCRWDRNINHFGQKVDGGEWPVITPIVGAKSEPLSKRLSALKEKIEKSEKIIAAETAKLAAYKKNIDEMEKV